MAGVEKMARTSASVPGVGGEAEEDRPLWSACCEHAVRPVSSALLAKVRSSSVLQETEKRER